MIRPACSVWRRRANRGLLEASAMKLFDLACGAAAATMILAASGCLVMTGSSIEESGRKISYKTLDQIEVGSTTESWVIGTLGDPTDSRTIDSEKNIKVLHYDHTVKRSGGGTVFLLFAGKSNSETTTSTYFEVTDGIVTRYWTEG
jgi:hypothetical protein